jgi:hypothetical protein
MKLHRLIISSCALVMSAVAPAYSAPIATYTDRTSWQGASSGVQTVTFENFSPASGLSSVTWDNATFTGTKNASPAVLQIFDTSVLSFYNFGTHYALFLDNFSFGAAVASDQTPEVDTLLMIGTGLTAVAAMRRRRSRT